MIYYFVLCRSPNHITHRYARSNLIAHAKHAENASPSSTTNPLMTRRRTDGGSDTTYIHTPTTTTVPASIYLSRKRVVPCRGDELCRRHVLRTAKGPCTASCSFILRFVRTYHGNMWIGLYARSARVNSVPPVGWKCGNDCPNYAYCYPRNNVI